MSKKIVRVEVIAEMEVDTDWYGNGKTVTDNEIKKAEGDNWIEWIGDNFIISEKISVRDV